MVSVVPFVKPCPYCGALLSFLESDFVRENDGWYSREAIKCPACEHTIDKTDMFKDTVSLEDLNQTIMSLQRDIESLKTHLGCKKAEW